MYITYVLYVGINEMVNTKYFYVLSFKDVKATTYFKEIHIGF